MLFLMAAEEAEVARLEATVVLGVKAAASAYCRAVQLAQRVVRQTEKEV